MQKILIINTGGTIGMVHSKINDKKSPLRPSLSWEEVTVNYKFLEELNIDYVGISEIVDSVNMDYKKWIEIAHIIENNYEKYKGFVILHGTDTMSYTASALSFILKNLDKPIILTGSQIPIQKIRSDGLQNLLTSIDIIESNDKENPISEVCIFFRDYLFRGNRARKLNSTNYFGFSSPNYLPLAEAGTQITIYRDRLLQVKSNEKFYVDYEIDPNVLMIDIFPSFHEGILKKIFEGSHGIKGLVLRTYGSGNAPTNKEFLDVLKYIIDQGVIILNITQCPVGSVEVGIYESSETLNKLGIVSGYDMTPEAAITKFMYLLGKCKTGDEIKKMLTENVAGEITKI